ncbi:MAG: reductive dehalogenase [Anaerolineales bacterium]
MDKNGHYSKILDGKRTLAPYPMERVRHTDKITTSIVGEIKRLDARDQGFSQAMAGRLGPVTQREFGRFGTKSPLNAAMMFDFGKNFAPLRDGPVFPAKAPVPDDPAVTSNHIKALGYYLKAQGVGICELPQWAIYSLDQDGKPINLKHKYAIVLLSEWDYETMAGSTGHDWISNCESFLTYNASAHMANTMAAYIRRLGFPARANFQSGPIPAYDMILTPLIILAGLGELSRAGWALNPYLGGRFKASVVTTDLPLLPDQPIDIGLQAFCRICKKCAQACPSKAISSADDKVEHNGYMSWPLEMERCTKYRVCNQNGAGCGMCVKSCPWNKPQGWFHDLTRWTIRTIPFMDPWLVKLDTFFGYGRQDREWKWWFDFESGDKETHMAGSRENNVWQK